MSARDIMKLKSVIRRIAKEEGVMAQSVLQTFMFERLLARLVKTTVRDNLIIKGGLLLSNLFGLSRRTTMDLDASVRDIKLDETNIRNILSEVFATDVNDGVTFELKSISPIRDDDIYGGFRVKFIARLETLVVQLSADFSTGDVVIPEPKEYYFKSCFVDNLFFKVWGYTIETTLAEKIETVLTRGILNTRPRDFYDIKTLAESFKPDLQLLRVALHETCKHRGTLSVLDDPLSKIEELRTDPTLLDQWNRYRKTYSYASGYSFSDMCESISTLLSNLT